jgi:hypothetical protein
VCIGQQRLEVCVRIRVRVCVSLGEGYFVSVLGRRSRKRWLIVERSVFVLGIFLGISDTLRLVTVVMAGSVECDCQGREGCCVTR